MMRRRAAAGALVPVVACLVVAGIVLAVWPLHANGVSGTAIAPRYHAFEVGVSSYRPLPEHVTIAELRRLGVRVPQDAVEERRRLAAALIAAALVVGAAAGLVPALRAGRRAATGSAGG